MFRSNARFLRSTIVAVLIVLAGCVKDERESPGRTKVVFWHSFVASTVPALDELIARFEADHPDIEIDAQYVPTGDALIQKLVTSVQSKTAPDVSWIHSNYLQNLVEADAIHPMSHFIEGSNGLTDEDVRDIYPALLQAASWQGALYSLPMEATNLGLLYNKKLFREAGLDPNKPPETWEELYAYAKKLTLDKNGDGRREQMGLFVPVFPSSGQYSDWMVWQWMPFLWQAGGYVITEDQKKVLFNSDAGVKALGFWKKIYDDLGLRTFTTDYEAAFPSGQLAMALDGPWNLPRWEGRKGLEWGIASLPAGPVKRATIVGGEYLAIFKQSKNPNAAWTFVKWWIQPEVQAAWSMKSGYLPIRRGVKDIPDYIAHLEKHPGLKAYVDQMEFGQSPRPIDFQGLQISRAIAEAIESVAVGNEDPKTGLDKAAKKSNELLTQAHGGKK